MKKKADPNICIVYLSRGYKSIIDSIDSDLTSRSWTARVKDDRVYASRTNYQAYPKNVMLHKVIMERKLGRTLQPGELVDHIDNDPLNNRRSNLRIATHSQNMRNSKKRKNNTSGYKGVHWVKRDKRWRASIGINGKPVYLGHFDTAEEAHEAYKKAAVEFYGEFARFE